jgi:hypothetical protein
MCDKHLSFIYLQTTPTISSLLRGSAQKRIEEEMAVKIVFPSSKNEESIGKLS